MPVMGRLVGLGLVLALLAGGAVGLYNAWVYEVLSPFPLAWTHEPAELELVELLRMREALTRRLASARRIESASGLAVLAPGAAGAEVEAELAAVDQRIAELRARLAAGQSRGSNPR
jgi:hypothetical protein